MNRIRGIYLGTALFITALIYVAIFGDAGYLARRELGQRVNNLKENIEELKQENQVLHEKLQDLKGEAKAEDGMASEAIIIKFDGAKFDLSKSARAKPGVPSAHEVTLMEARAVYLVAAIFLILSGFCAITIIYPRNAKS